MIAASTAAPPDILLRADDRRRRFRSRARHKDPPSTIGLPKSPRLSTNTTSHAFASPGTISGRSTARKVRMADARSVCDAPPCWGRSFTTPISTRKAVGREGEDQGQEDPLKP
jgi:hypothetical protein